jgi:hypothetical protein
MEEMAGKDTTKAIETLDTLPAELQPGARAGVVEKWAERDPVKAAAYVEGLGDIPGRPDSVRSLVWQWAGVDARAASEYTAALSPGPARDQAARSLANRIRDTDPEAASTWCLEIQDTKIRDSILGWVFQGWETNPKAARAWVETNQERLGADQTAKLLKRLGEEGK